MKTETDFSNYIGHEVVDNNGDKIGTLECLWTDDNGEPTFLGVRTGWFIGKTHVVPANQAHVSESGRKVRLPYDAERIKAAPSYDPGVELDDRTGREVYSYYGIGQGQQQARTRQAGAREQASVTLSEEELKVGKRQVEYGGVRLRKIIRTEVVNQPVELQREEIVVERTPAGRGSQARGKSFEQEEVYIPLRREEAVVQKEAHVREEVRVSKRSEKERQNIQERVRKEDVQVERSGQQGRQTVGPGVSRARSSRARARRAIAAVTRPSSPSLRVTNKPRASLIN
jgi:uncharacterized protein (TIGR02271 family)